MEPVDPPTVEKPHRVISPFKTQMIYADDRFTLAKHVEFYFAQLHAEGRPFQVQSVITVPSGVPSAEGPTRVRQLGVIVVVRFTDHG